MFFSSLTSPYYENGNSQFEQKRYLTSSSLSLAKGHIVKANGIWLFFIISAVHGILYIVDLIKLGLQFPEIKRTITFTKLLIFQHCNM